MLEEKRFYSGLNIEGTSCRDCGCPFMLSVMQVAPVSNLILPSLIPKGSQNGHETQGQIPMKPLQAWRICISCLRREVTKPNERGWEIVSHHPGTARRIRRLHGSDDVS